MADGIRVSLVSMTLADCANNSVCLYANAGWTSQMVTATGAGARIDLTAYQFNDSMSSWANKTSYDARWFYNAGFSGTTRCMKPKASDTYVGSADNDQASSLAIYTDAAAC